MLPQPEAFYPHFDRLPELERNVLSMHHGAYGHDPVTLAQIGKALGVCPNRVRQIELRGMSRIKTSMFPKPKGGNPHRS